MTDPEAVGLARELLERETTMVLATAGDDGIAHATPLFFWASAGMELCWYSSAESAHSRHIAMRAEVSASVFAPTQDWRSIRGLQLMGECHQRSFEPDGYLNKFGLGDEMRPVIERSVPYVFQPRWLRYIDNAYGFGFRHEVKLTY